MNLIHDIPYTQNSPRLFNEIKHLPWPIFFDSGTINKGFDIICANPYCTFINKNKQTTIHHDQQTIVSEKPILELIRQYLGKPQPSIPNIPFCGGVAGWFGYEMETLHSRHINSNQKTADAVIGLYDWALIINHSLKKCTLVSQQRHPQTIQDWQQLIDYFTDPKPIKMADFKVTSPIKATLSQADYNEAFKQIQQHIKDGDCYQVNFSQSFSANASGEGWAAYQILRKIAPAPFSCYFKTPEGEVLSTSPERFLSLRYGIIETKPIKGTIPRGKNKQQDQLFKQHLIHSIKDRAENVMIVDLLRNDLGRCCQIGTVHVPLLFKIESFSNVHHLVSTVRGLLAKNKDAISVLNACFPGGSITGAPKIKAMEIIEQLEKQPRGIYCGALGYIGFDGQMDTNIAIRTLFYKDHQITFNVGGGIVADSDMAAEYQETLDKASGILKFVDQVSKKS